MAKEAAMEAKEPGEETSIVTVQGVKSLGMQESASDTSGSKDGILGSLGETSTSANPSLKVILAWTIPI